MVQSFLPVDVTVTGVNVTLDTIDMFPEDGSFTYCASNTSPNVTVATTSKTNIHILKFGV